MNTILRRPVRAGLILSTLVALLAFAARLAEAQTTPQRLTLGDAVRIAARQGALVQSAQLRAGEAQARVTQARSALLPDLSAGASQGERTFNTASFGISFPSAPGQPPLFDPSGQVEGPVRSTDVRARASLDLVDLAAISRVRASRSAARAAEADAANVSDLAAAGAAQAYLRALRADAQLEARVADSTLAVELIGIAQQQLRAGVGVALDVTRAESQLAGVRAQLIAVRNDRDRSRLDLLRALDLSLDSPIELADSLGTAGPVAPADQGAAVAEALRQRADVRAVEEQIAAATRQLQATRAERLPSVGAFGDDGWQGKSASVLLPTYSWGIQLSLPIFDGLRREGRVEEQQLQTRELRVRDHDLRQQVAVDVRGALLDLSSARQEVDASRERLRLAEQEVSQARERFRAGVSGNADVITASLTLNAARTQLIDALTAYQAAAVGLARAEGNITRMQ